MYHKNLDYNKIGYCELILGEKEYFSRTTAPLLSWSQPYSPGVSPASKSGPWLFYLGTTKDMMNQLKAVLFEDFHHCTQ